MNLALFGGSDRRPLGLGWTKETFVASRHATLRVVAIFGGPGRKLGTA